MQEFIKGADISTLLEEERNGARFYDRVGKKSDLLSVLRAYNFNYVRLRLWNNPYSHELEPYGAGTCDLNTVIELARRAKEKGMKILLDLHYSDFWADPGKQFKPKEWEKLSVSELTDAVHDFTFNTMLSMVAENVYPDMVQVGNELSNGLLWPEGKWPEFDNIAAFVSAGIRAVREADELKNRHTEIMIHLDNGGNNRLYREWFDNYISRGEDFDIIGLSYYPFWHGTLSALERNMVDIAARYGKKLVVAEVSMGFSMEDYGAYERLAKEDRKGYATKKSLVENIDYPMSPEGQAKFTEDFLTLLDMIPNKAAIGFFWWEPGWIPVPGVGWATPASLEYMHDKGPCGNEWANQALFDYNGHPLPALDVIKEF